ncbi:hypothetical protein P3X46_016065 [Hevea brasiliensis]|uniref:Protodermal factor 1 n=1 Tax=Hevea brasiliensis TaxID=3981 RepID=A0ABQ9M1X9_HEVBR|nr:hypothetical protein P3X46_016065 [Hevea brasiliensis]
MGKEKYKQTSLLMWVLGAGLLCQNLVIVPVMATFFEDQKNYPSPDPHAASPPTGRHSGTPSHGGSHGGTPSHGGSYGGAPPTPPTQSNGNCGTPPSVPTPSTPPSEPTPSTPPTVPTPSIPSDPPQGGGGYYPSPPSSGGSPPTPIILTPPTVPTPSIPPSEPTPSTPPTVPTPSIPSDPPQGGGGYYPSPPSSGGSPPTPIILTPPSTPFVPSPPSTPFVPSPPFIPDPNSPFTCNYWRNHPGIIFGLLGWWGTLGSAFGTNSLPGLGAGMSLPQALSNTRTDGYGTLYREGTAALLNSMYARRFPFTTSQVRENFLTALASNKAAAAQGQLFKLANEGRLKPRN